MSGLDHCAGRPSDACGGLLGLGRELRDVGGSGDRAALQGLPATGPVVVWSCGHVRPSPGVMQGPRPRAPGDPSFSCRRCVSWTRHLL